MPRGQQPPSKRVAAGHAISLAEQVAFPNDAITSNQLTLFAEAFPVSPIVSPADAAPPPMTATSGAQWPFYWAFLTIRWAHNPKMPARSSPTIRSCPATASSQV